MSQINCPTRAANPPLGFVRPELIAPAGDWDCLKAAVENGADAVYFGLNYGHNARMRAANFRPQELAAVMASLHRRGMRGYVTLNTLLFSGELADVEHTVRDLVQAGADAVLVQDLGLLRLVREICPELAIHASTQMTLASAEAIEVVRELGIERVVLARELSLEEIRRIHEHSEMPLEVFVHGALCVAYSGQCLTSESLGGRSANRGVCAQACRLPYELVCDGRDVDLGKVKYLLSPQDLAAFALIPDLLAAGVSSFKIEGRLKKPEYVANITHHYRTALDAASANQPVQFTPRQIEEMELSFSRGFSPGWLQGNDHKRLVPGLSSAKRGVFLGLVQAIHLHRVTVELASSVSAGDGVVFEGDRTQNDEQGGRVFSVFRGRHRFQEPVHAGPVELTFARDAIDLSRLWVGQSLWKTDDPALTARLQKTFRSPEPKRKLALDLFVQASVGQPLVVIGHAETGAACHVESDHVLAAATQHPLTEEMLRTQLGRLGRSAYQLRELGVRLAGQPMVPLSVLGRVRREMILQLDAWADRPLVRSLAAEAVLPKLRGELCEMEPRTHEGTCDAPQINSCPRPAPPAPELHVLVRAMSQLEAVLACGVRSVLADFEDIRQYRQAVQLARSHTVEICLATPRIQKPGEMGIFRSLLRHEADGILVRNLAGLRFFAQHRLPLVADFSLNAANELTVGYLRRQGAQRITASYDLNREQLLELATAVPPSWLEVVVHQHMPLFHMEHCVFCAVLSPGTNKTNCGRPCDRHHVQLRDRIGAEHVLKADVGCRNTLFNAIPQSAAEAVPQLSKLGVRHFRVELLDDKLPELRKTIQLYQGLLSGHIGGKQVWRELKAANRVGVTRGTLEERRHPLAIL